MSFAVRWNKSPSESCCDPLDLADSGVLSFRLSVGLCRLGEGSPCACPVRTVGSAIYILCHETAKTLYEC